MSANRQTADGELGMDLFTPIISEELQHPYFRAICAHQNGYNCDVLNEWARGFKDRDGKFVYEFQRTFDTCFWELYVFAVLKHYGLTVDFSHPAPDFLVTDNGGFNVEATVALHAKDATPEYMKFEEPIPQDLNEFNRRAILRIRNSIDGKHKKFNASYQKLDHVKGRPFVLAITAIDSPHAILACQRAIEAVLFGYYVDEEKYLREGGELKGYEVNSVAKDNGSPVELGVFKKEDFRWLSAVVFSSCATWGKVRALSADPNPNIIFEAVTYNTNGPEPKVVKAKKANYTERLLDGLRVYHNPSATHPLDIGVFRHRDVFQSYYSEHQDDWAYELRDGLLLSRTVKTFLRRPLDGIAPARTASEPKETQ
jgi:hypothetical protein